MGRVPQLLHQAAAVLVLLAVLAAASCTSPFGPPAGTAPGTAAGTAPPAPPGADPVTAGINQFRDNYSKQIIEIQLTNTTGAPITVLAAAVQSPLFGAGISWTAAGAGVELPPGQTKSLPAQLPEASCQRQPPAGEPSAGRAEAGPTATLTVEPAPGAGTAVLTAAAADPFGVLARNYAELCLARAAAGVADFRLSPDLEVSPDGRSAVLRLLVTPHDPGAAGSGASGSTAGSAAAGGLTIRSVGGTPLLAEDGRAPWPRDLRIDTAGPAYQLRLGIRPARCDPHAVADDKVGTLIPLTVAVAGREGVLKVDAGSQLRGRIYDFVTNACGRQ